jgi:peptidoglycan/LPS O-acetylase OafA/YrhL
MMVNCSDTALPLDETAAPRQARGADGASLAGLAQGRLPGLDGLRALSILLVMLSHFGFGSVVPGALGVTIFFFLSGFLITTLLQREMSETGRVNVHAFLIRRVLRLQPELAAYILITGLLGAALLGLPRPIDFLAGLFYFSNYYQLAALAGATATDFRWPHLWSLAVEEHFYLVYALGFMALFRGRALLVMATLCLAILAWRYVIVIHFENPRYAYEATDARIDSILYGCLAAFILWRHGAALRSALGGGYWIPGLAGLALLGFSLLCRDPLFRDAGRFSVQGVALMLMIASAYLGNGANFAIGLLELAPCQWMGRMSYAAYLWHFDVFKLFELYLPDGAFETARLRNLPLAAAMIAITFAIAWLSHRAIYRPMLRLRRGFGSHAGA